MPSVKNLVVIGQGAAGLSATLSALESAKRAGVAIQVRLLEKAPADEAGGNTRWTPAYMRLQSMERVEESFVADMMAATDGQGDRAYFEQLGAEAAKTVQWIAAHGVAFHQPVYYLAKGPPRIQPVGGGAAVFDALTRAALQHGATIRTGVEATELVWDGAQLNAVRLSDGTSVPADAVVIACGGFQGHHGMMAQHFGRGGENLPLLAPRARFNTGDGIRMAQDAGADVSGEWSGMHAEPVDPRSAQQAPVMLLYPYGVVVDKRGRRFFDEGAGLVHETWERFARDIHFQADGQEVYAIFDRRVFDIPDWRRATRSDVPPVEAPSLAALAAALQIDAEGLERTVAEYNSAAIGDPARFDATHCDGLAAAPNLDPPKSNWARAITDAPFVAYPLIGAIAYTFGGIATDASARMLRDGKPLPGLYAAGEITGHFYGTAPNAVSVLRAFVFGRIAGREAVADLIRP